MSEFEVFIGLEIHVQLLTETKMFCSCPAKFGAEPNQNVCPVCLGYPGTLPVPNMQAIDYAYRIAHALNCTLAPVVQFDRKNYYYPDLPKNYQITQFYYPTGTQGSFNYIFDADKIVDGSTADGQNNDQKGDGGNGIRSLNIKEAHLEEDAGKLVHSSDVTLCDYNRSGTPLMEIVTEPELKSPEEAESMLKQFRRLVRYLDVCDGNMEEGSLRCDANISLNRKGKGLGSKVEIKNVNSFRFVRMALEYEIERQSTLLSEGESVVQETRLWNENRDITEGMRTKENADDYRYLPDPDIIPYKLPEQFFKNLSEKTIELPMDRRARFSSDYKMEGKVLDFFTEEKGYADYFERCLAEGAQPDLLISWCTGDVQKILNKNNLEIEQSPLTSARLGRMLVLLQEGTLHGKLAKHLLEKIFTDDEDPEVLVERYNFKAASKDEIVAAIQKVLSEHQDAHVQIKSGDKKPLGFLMGQLMKETGGRADPQELQKTLDELL